jgi:bacillolysin
MRILLVMLLLSPMMAKSQIKNIAYDCEGMHVPITIDNLSPALDKFLNLSAEFTFTVDKDNTISDDETGANHYTVQQFFKGYQVEGLMLRLHYNGKVLNYINGEYIDKLGEMAIQIPEDVALTKALDYIHADKYKWENQSEHNKLASHSQKPKGEYVVLPGSSAPEAKPHLVYKFDIYAVSPLSRNYVYVSAQDGKILGTSNRIQELGGTGTADTRYSGNQDISIATKNNGTNYSLEGIISPTRHLITHTTDFSTGTNTELFDNDNYWSSIEYTALERGAFDAHWGTIVCFNYFKAKFGRLHLHHNLPLDEPIESSLHTQGTYVGINFFYDGKFLNYSDGIGTLQPTCLDIVAHEYGHAVSTHVAVNIDYFGGNYDVANDNQHEAILEGIADIWGACVEDYAALPNKNTWTIGEEVAISPATEIRSLSNPKADGQPDTYHGTNWAKYRTGPNINFLTETSRVTHANSGVMSHWFYLLSQGGTGTNDIGSVYTVNGMGIDKAAQIAYLYYIGYMTNMDKYEDARKLTIKAAQDLYGNCSPEVIATMNAWYAVGVGNAFNLQANIVIPASVLPNAKMSEYAYQTITTAKQIQANAQVKYEAGHSITMLPGFVTDANVVYLAQIAKCQDLTSFKRKNVATIASSTPTTLTNKSASNTNQAILVYPNPSRDMVYINTPYQAIDRASSTIEISDLHGRLIQSIAVDNAVMRYSMADLATGCYYLKVKYQDGFTHFKLIKN